MKLKLEAVQDQLQTPVTVLVISEKIEAHDLAVLKAGLNKIFNSGKKRVLLDLDSAELQGTTELPIIEGLLDLRNWAATAGAQLLIVSANEALGHSSTRDEALHKFQTGEAEFLIAEAKLQTEIKTLQQKKDQLIARLNPGGGSQAEGAENGDPKQLLRRNSELKRSLSEIERLSHRFIKARGKDPFALASTELARETLEQVLNQVLTSEGILA
jgi:hypothetical protein